LTVSPLKPALVIKLFQLFEMLSLRENINGKTTAIKNKENIIILDFQNDFLVYTVCS